MAQFQGISHYYSDASGSAATYAPILFTIAAAGGSDTLAGPIPREGPPAAQSVYIDNSANAGVATVVFNDTGFAFKVPSNSQGWFDVLSREGNFNVTVSLSVAGSVLLIATSERVAPMVWKAI